MPIPDPWTEVPPGRGIAIRASPKASAVMTPMSGIVSSRTRLFTRRAAYAQNPAAAA